MLTVSQNLVDGGFRMVARYDDGDESVRRFVRQADGKQVLVFARFANRKRSLAIEHWEVFVEVSMSNETAIYLEQMVEAIGTPQTEVANGKETD